MELHQIPTTATKPGVKATSTILLFFGALLLFLLALFLLPTVTAPGPGERPMQAAAFVPLTTGSLIEIESDTFNLGQMRMIAITATVPQTASLNAFTIHVEYDPAIVDYNHFCAVNSIFIGICSQSDDDGIPPDVVSITGISTSGVNGVVQLGEFRFVGTGLGTTPLHLVVGTWSDGNPDPPITIDGTITINPAATSTVTPSATASPGPSPTASMTPTPGPSPTASMTPTSTPGPSPTASTTPTPGPSPTASTTPPPTPTSPTATPTATSQVSPTPTSTPTVLPTETATVTATPTPPKEDEYFIYLPIVLKN